MPRTTAGRKYPYVTTDARQHNHRMCPVVQVIADRVTAGAEEWGVLHPMPPVPSETIAREIRAAFYAAKYCRQLAARYGDKISVKSEFDQQPDGTYTVWVKVWTRTIARQEIARRVAAGEPLAYNVTRRS